MILTDSNWLVWVYQSTIWFTSGWYVGKLSSKL